LTPEKRTVDTWDKEVCSGRFNLSSHYKSSLLIKLTVYKNHTLNWDCGMELGRFSTTQTDSPVSLHFKPDYNFKMHVSGNTLFLHFPFSKEEKINNIHKQFVSRDIV
jgi:hypothetical protein